MELDSPPKMSHRTQDLSLPRKFLQQKSKTLTQVSNKPPFCLVCPPVRGLKKDVQKIKKPKLSQKRKRDIGISVTKNTVGIRNVIDF